jgi:hypothetical protein
MADRAAETEATLASKAPYSRLIRHKADSGIRLYSIELKGGETGGTVIFAAVHLTEDNLLRLHS